MPAAITKSISLRFRFWVFACMVLVVFIHAYNLNIRYLQPWTLPREPMTPTTFIEYFISNGITRFAIPLLFAISGYLYALKDDQPYRQRIKKRLRVLLIPYLVWSAAGIVFVYLLELFPYTKAFVASSGIVQISNDRLLLHNYHWYELVARWVVIPVSYQLWFLRVLIIYNLVYPLLRWCILHKTIKWIFFAVLLLLWLDTFGAILVEGEGLLFFSLGIWLQKNNFNIETPPRRLNPFVWGVIFIVVCTLKTWLAFNGQKYSDNTIFPLLAVLHKLTIISGVITAWYGGNRIAVWCMQRKWFLWLSSFSFIIYVMHAPAVAIAINAAFAWLQYIPGYRIIAYLLLPAALIILCIIFGALLRKLLPGLYGFVTGERGLG